MGENIQVLTLADISGERHRDPGAEFRNRRHKTDPDMKVKAPPNLMTHCLVGRFKKIRVKDQHKPEAISAINTHKTRSLTAPAGFHHTQEDGRRPSDPADQEPGDTQRILDQVYLANIYGLDELDREHNNSVADVTKNKSDVEVESVFEAPLDFVMTTVKINRMQRLDNIAVGITPGNYSPAKKKRRGKSKDSNTKQKETKIKFSSRTTPGESPDAKTPKSFTKGGDNRGWFPFPKDRDFISPDSKRIDSAGVDWMMKTTDDLYARPITRREPTVRMNIPDANASKKTIPGKLCRNKCPVTEALNRHGTSLTKQKGKILQPGDCNINKVWRRRLSNVFLLSPHQMAREDIMTPQSSIPEISVDHLVDIPKVKNSLYRGYTI